MAGAYPALIALITLGIGALLGHGQSRARPIWGTASLRPMTAIAEFVCRD